MNSTKNEILEIAKKIYTDYDLGNFGFSLNEDLEIIPILQHQWNPLDDTSLLDV